MKKVVPCILATWLFISNAQSQTPDSLLLRYDPVIAEMDSILNSADSLSILDLIDSILMAPELPSQLAVRVGYNNNVVANNINQFGLTLGTSFYHKSGAYVDVSSYYSREFDPSVYLTVGAVGYLTAIKDYWSLLVEYDHYFYSKPKGDAEIYTPYTNNLYFSNYFKYKKGVFRLDYNFFFGDLLSHRITPSLGLNLTKKKWLGLDRVTFLPAVGLWYGSDTISEYVPNFDNRRQFLLLLLQRKPTFSLVDRTVWGIMNYTMSFPLSVSYKNWSAMVSYTLNFQKGLPGESFNTYRTGFVAASLVKYFDL